ncbi:MAG TPA: energy transducer TonB [Gemmatimonadales bacterium]|nr:energy transducer TonB [Gemmatimonadales bacterium]
MTPAPPANGCAAASQPDPLPTPAQLIGDAPIMPAFDSAGVTDTGAVLVSLTFGDHGAVTSLRALDGTLPGAQASAALTVLRQYTMPVPTLANTSIRLVVRRSDSLSILVGYSEYCPPQPLPSAYRQTFTTKVRVDQPGQVESIRQPEFRALVDELGRIARIELVMTSGYPDLDQQLMAGIRSATYRAATVDGQPRAAWISLPPR